MQDGAADEKIPVEGVEPLRPREGRLERVSSRPASHPDAQRRSEAEAQTDMGWTPREWERVFDAAGDAIFLTDREFKIARANRATSQVLGKPLNEILGKTYWQAIHGIDQPPETSPLAQAHHTKTHVQGEIYVSQRAVWLEVSVDPMLDEKGDVTGVLHILRDVTDGKKMKEAMRESEEKYRNLFENAQEAILLIDLKGNITAVNQIIADYGFQREELVGQRLFDFVVANHRTRAIADFQVLLGGKPVEGEMDVITPKGIVCVEYKDNPIRRDGQIVGVQAILTDVTKRKRAEQLLREERDKAQKYLDIAGVMLVVIDSEERVALINKKGCEILGYTEQEVLCKNWFDNFLPERIRSEIRGLSTRMLKGEIEVNERYENPVLAKNGDERLIRWHGVVLRDEKGVVVGHLNSGEDITDRRRAEEAYHSLVDHSLQGLAIFQDGKVVFANRAMAEMAGYTIDEMLALSIEQVRDFVHPEDREMVWRNQQRRLAGEPVPEHYELRGIRKDGLACWLDLHASRIEYRGKPAIQAAYIDVTERKRAEDALRLSEQRYRGIFENAVLGMYQTTPDGQILMVNPALVRMLGYDTFEQLAARNLEKEGYEAEHPRSLFKDRIEADGQIVGLESAWKRRDGSTLWVRESARAVRDEVGKTLFYEGTVEDITERKHADQLMRTLATAAMELVELPADADLFQFIGEKVLALIGEGIVSVNSIEGDTLTVRQITGATTVAMKLAQRLLGRAVIGMPVKGLHEVARSGLLTGKLTKVEGGLYELFFRTVPGPACWTLERGLGIRECHSIGIRRRSTVLGSVTILTQKGTELNAGVIEAFVNQASVALERRGAEEVLRESEVKYRELFENAREAIVIIDLDKTITDANKFVEEYGFRKADLIGRNYLEFVAEPYGEKAIVDFELLRQGMPLEGEFEVVTPKGRVVVFYKDCPIVRNGRVVGVQSMLTDITERKWAEEALKESESRYRLLADNASDVIWTADRSLRLTYCSPSVERVLGYTADEMLTKGVSETLTPASCELVEKVLAEEMEVERTGQGDPLRSRMVEVEEVRKDGTTLWVEVRADFLRDADGKAVGIVGVTRDISNRKRIEQQLLDYQARLRELATGLTLAEERERRRIAVGVHDQIGQRLALTKLTLQSLAAASSGEKVSKVLNEASEEIEKVIEEAHSLTFELSNPVLYEVGFEGAVESWLTEQVQERHGIECTFAAGLHPLRLDQETSVTLFHVVRELLTNVIKHAKAKHVDVRIRRIGETVQITLQDDGIGFQPAQNGHIVSKSGGFGLFNVQEKLDYLGGSVKIKSELGKGCCVVIVAPPERCA
jgi:PAS domain S-box-containing protein